MGNQAGPGTSPQAPPPPQAPPQAGGKPGGPPGQDGPSRGGMSFNQMPVSDPSQMAGQALLGGELAGIGSPPPGIGQMGQMAADASGQNNGINPQSGLPWGQHPGMGGAGNPFAPQTPDPFAQVPGGYRPPGAPPPNMYPGMNAPNQNRWGPGSSAGPGIPGPYDKIDPNTYLTKRPEGFNTFLGDTAAKNMIAPHERTAQSYGESYSRTPPPPQRKKGGK